MKGRQPRSLPTRMLGAALLRADVYEEVEADPDATVQAAIVVAAVALASAAGTAASGAAGLLAGLVAAYMGWLVWSGITYLIGDKLLGGTATWGELLRTIGFALSPGVLYTLGALPRVGGWLTLAVIGWILIAVVIAIRQALDFGTGRALLTAVLGLVVYLLVQVVVMGLADLGPGLS